MKTISRQRRDELVDALRRGTVPMQSLDLLAVGLEPFETALQQELESIKAGGARFKALRGEYGTGKTFFSRWLGERARQIGFATSEVQISETETPLHRLETVYRRLMERLGTPDTPTGAFQNVLDGWFYTLEEDVLAEGTISPSDQAQLLERSNTLMEKRLAAVTQSAPMFSVALRGYHSARATGDTALADGIAAWLAGQPNVAAGVKRQVGVKGDIDHFGAMSFLQGLLTVLRDSGHAGLYLVLDEVETIQRVRGDVRDKSLNALRQFIDDIDSGRFPGLYLLVTGTPAFFDGPQGAQRLEPLAQRLHVDFTTDAKFDNPRAIQIRLAAFDLLHPGLQHHIVNSLGWRELRPFQEEVIPAALQGEHLLVIAPTAGGKTEAAILPVLSRMLSEDWRGLSVLYLCPIRALLNNLHIRLSRYATLVGRSCSLWHGDVTASERNRINKAPPDILLTTPESLEVMLVSKKTDPVGLLGQVRAVVVDELHAFAGDDRGWHLLSVLQRVSRLAGREFQRIGLSATVGNPEVLLRWLCSGGTQPSRVISPAVKTRKEAAVQLDFVGSLTNAATVQGP